MVAMGKDKQVTDRLVPSRLLYTMIRVADLGRSTTFYRDMLGINEMRRETFTEGRFTLAFMGHRDGPCNALIELTYNWFEDEHELGTGYGHIALEVVDIYAVCKTPRSSGCGDRPQAWADEPGRGRNRSSGNHRFL